MINAGAALTNLVFVDDPNSGFGGDPDVPIALIDDTDTGYYPMIATVLNSTTQNPPIITNPGYPYLLFKQETNSVLITDNNMSNLLFTNVYLNYNAQLQNY